MNMSELSPLALAGLRGRLSEHEPMSRHVSWRAGGAARRAYLPADAEDLAHALQALPADEPVCVVGLGSNLLVRDGGFPGTVVFTHGALKAIALTPERLLYAEAGVAGAKVARFAALHGLRAAEFLSGIPGTVGGALAMNAGCYGGETWRIVDKVLTVDRAGAFHARTPADYDIGYRTVVRRDEGERMKDEEDRRDDGDPSSLVPHPSEEWFVAASFRLPDGDPAQARGEIRQLLQRRLETQPLDRPNAGSVFRNPQGDYAARLIEACGLKGRRSGGAMISDKHANFIVNAGGASAADIEALIDLAQRTVRERFGVDLVREVRIIGEPS